MKSMRKSLAFLVVLTMVLSTIAPVLAATPADVAGTDYESAVGNLAALSIVSGDANTGNYRPEDNITRAEFARVICSLLRMQEAATLAGSQTKFKDVTADYAWAAGFINVAAQAGLFSGYPDGTFKPGANITYAEAISVLVRAIGMGTFVQKQGGTWPANYLTAGSTSGITSDVAGLSGDGKAIRGVIAQLAWNTLGAEKWGPKEYTTEGITYGPMDKSLMQELYKNYVYLNQDDNFEIKWFEDVKVTGTYTGGTIDANQIKIDTTDDEDLADIAGATGTAVTVDVADGINTISLYGQKVDLFFGKDNKVVNLVVATPAKNLLSGFITDYDAANEKIEIGATAAATDGTEYGFASEDVKVFINSALVSVTADQFFDQVKPLIDDSNVKVSAILNSGSIETLKLTVCDEFDPDAILVNLDGVAGNDAVDIVDTTATDFAQFVVKEINSKNEVKSVASSSATMFDLDDLTDTDDYAVVKDGKVVAKSEIKAGDAVTYMEKANFTYIIVSGNTVKGKITKNSADNVNALNGEDRRKFTIDGKVYEMAFDGSAAFTKNASIDDDDVTDAIDDTEMADFTNKEATLTLNAVGDIVFVNGSITASSANMQVGVITRAAATSGEDYSVKIMGQDAVAKSYTLKSGDIYDTTGVLAGAIYAGDLEDITDANEADLDDNFDALVAGTIVMFEASADSKIDSSNFYVLALDKDGVADGIQADEITEVNYGDLYVKDVTGAVDTVKDTTKKINVNADTYIGKAATSYINVNLGNIEKIEGWDSIESDDYDDATPATDADTVFDTAGLIILVADEDDNLKSIILDVADTGADVDLDPDYLSSDELFGLYIDEESNADNDDLVNLFVDGAAKQYVVNGTVYGTVDEGDLVVFQVNGESEYADDTIAIDVSYIQGLVDSAVPADNVAAEVYKISDWDKDNNNLIEFEAAGDKSAANGYSQIKVNIASDAVVYDCTGDDPKVGSLADLKDGLYVSVEDYDEEEDTFGVVVIAHE